MGWLQAILAIPGLGKLLAGIGKAATYGLTYWKGRSDAATAGELTAARQQLELADERRASDRQVAARGADDARERLRRRLDAAGRQ